MTKGALLGRMAKVICRSRSDLSARVVAHQAVLAPLRIVRDLGRPIGQRPGRIDPSLRIVAGIARALQVVFGRPVAIAAYVLGDPQSCGVAHVARGSQVRAFERYRVILRRQRGILKRRRPMAGLTG